jgi:hypothetical protein
MLLCSFPGVTEKGDDDGGENGDPCDDDDGDDDDGEFFFIGELSTMDSNRPPTPPMPMPMVCR